MGTAAYMSPEQAKGEDVDERSDIWPLGVMFHEMVAGERPFAAENERAVLYSIGHEPPTSIRHIGIDVPPALAWIVEGCLSEDPGGRHQSAPEVTTRPSKPSGLAPKGSTARRLTAT